MRPSGFIVGLVIVSWLAWNTARAQTGSPAPSSTPAPANPVIDQLRAKAEAGDASAQLRLADAYHAGLGVSKDDAQTFAWCLKAAQQGNLKAELAMASLCEYGIGTVKDELASFQWDQKAADQGYAPAESIVASHYYQGIDVAKNMTEAFKWYKKAADQDDATGEQQLAFFYLNGDPSFRDLKKGLTYALSASGRNNVASSYVADCYGRGIFVKADLVQAYAYALHSDALGPTEWNSQQLAWYKSKLTPDELERAKQVLTWLQNRWKGVSQTDELTFNMSGQPSIKIPFRNMLNILVVTASVGNQPPADFVIDTGTSSSCLDSRYAARLGLESNDYKAAFALGSEPSLMSVSDPTSLTLGALTWNAAQLYITPLSMDGEMGQPIAGIIGSDVLKQLVVHIDYEHNIIELIDPKSFHPTADMGEPMPLIFKSELPLPFVPASIVNEGTESKKETFLFDTGDTGAVGIKPGFWIDNPGVPFTSKKAGGATGFDGVVVHHGAGVCSALALGPTRLEQVLVDTSSSANGWNINSNGGTIGNEVWRRFDVTLDYLGKRLFLQKNSHIDEPWNYPKAGVHVVAGGSDYKTLTVMQILPDSAGARAGFQVGDVILKINDLNHPDIEQVHSTFRTVGDYHVLVQRQQQTVALDLHCADDLK